MIHSLRQQQRLWKYSHGLKAEHVRENHKQLMIDYWKSVALSWEKAASAWKKEEAA